MKNLYPSLYCSTYVIQEIEINSENLLDLYENRKLFIGCFSAQPSTFLCDDSEIYVKNRRFYKNSSNQGAYLIAANSNEVS